ncbi:putative bifunctional diguanylate cyclase/phosphodiesterase [Catellatospora methionotrophica]|uniref:putative bifunctional diguanylate cyclase/phosphodiesterase n=1 Tax=Catellatospora methionotrophica TaxID=121620 RepID=UPI0033F349E0
MTGQRSSSQQTDRQLRLLVGLVACSAALVLLAAVTVAVLHPVAFDQLMQVVALTGLVTLTSLAQVHVRIRSNLQSVHWADAALLVAAVLLPVHWAIICATAGTFIVKVIQRPQPGPLKFAFAVAKQTITCAIAALIVNINGSVATEPLAHLQLLAIAFAAAFLADELLVTPVIALASRTRARDRFLAHLDLRVIAAVVRFAVAVLALAVLSQEPQLLIAIPAIVLSLQLTYRGKLRARAERLAWQQLAEATDAMNVVQMETVLHTAVHNGARLFSADRVEIEVSLDGAQQLVRGSQGEITYHAAPDQGTVDPDTTAVVALVGDNDGERVGELRLCFQAPVALSEREQFTLRAFAGALCTAIRNATSYAQLEHLAGQHQHDATHDLLTGLPNRRRLQLDTEDALDRRRGGRGVTALLVLDLNHFKDVNDALGHAAGDQVLIAVAQRLSAAAGPEALVTRLGGDEFAVLLRQLPAPALALYQAEHLLSTLHEPVDVDGMPLVVSASAGVATAPSEGGFVELLRRADIAMYQAKRTGCSVASYAPDNDTADRARLVVGGMLPRAVAEKEFILQFQPIVDLASGEPISAEALARWQHPDKGMVDPRSFLGSIERSGLLTAFTDAVLDQALAGAARWRELGCRWPVAVNISPRSLLDRRLPALVTRRLDDHGLPGDALVLELTESHTVSQLDIVDKVLAELAELGCMIALDDFGTGYSSLSVLSRVPAKELKIDRSFVMQMENTPSAAAVVRSHLELGRHLDLLVVAEGVERESQRRMLWDLGCTAGQGHLFAKPMPLDEVLALVSADDGPVRLAEPLHDPTAVVRMPAKRNPGRISRTTGTGGGERVSDSTT